ncbi:MAG: DUF58 domain-containing protein [Microbacteriaceae bacterium]
MTLRADSHFPTATEGLTNARTRIVGNRTGPGADAVVGFVRLWKALTDTASTWFSRLASVITPLGWVTVSAAPTALILGYSWAWVELIIAGYVGLVLVVVAAIYLIGRTSVEVALSIPHSRVVVGDTAVAHVTATNSSRRRIIGTTVEVPVGGGVVELAIPSLAADSSSVQTFAVPTSRRGVVLVGPARTVRADPIGLVRRELIWTEAAELFVHPRTIGIPSLSSGLIRDLEGNPTADLTNSDVSFHALREYQPGDDRRYIHWKSTAKTGTHMVRQFEETRRSHIIIALSLASADFASEAEFELAVSVTGSLGVRAIRDVREVSVVVSEKTSEFAKRKNLAVRPLSTLSRSRMLDELSVQDTAETALSVVDLALVAGAQVLGVSVAFLVCGSTPTPAELRSASMKFPLGVEVIAVVCNPEKAPGLRRVSGLSVLTIGFLEDLQKSLAKVTSA